MTIYMPDVSEWQAKTNVKSVLKQTGGALIIRAGYGASHKDLIFDSARSHAHKAGVRSLGIYHYVTAGSNITLQAEAFVKWVGKRQAGEWFCIDLEEGSGNQLSRARTWMNLVTQKLGGFVTIYSGDYFAGTHGLSSLFASGEGWIAAYGSTPSHKYMLHQYSNGSYSPRNNWPGAGYCDTNRFSGSLDQFVAKTTGSAIALTKEDDDVPYVVSLQCTSQKVTKGKPTWVLFNKENSDSRGQHAKGNYPGILTTAKFCDINGKVHGCDGTHYFVAVNMKTKKERSIDVGEHLRNEVATATDALYANEHLYLKFIPNADGVIGAWAKGLYWT